METSNPCSVSGATVHKFMARDHLFDPPERYTDVQVANDLSYLAHSLNKFPTMK